MSTEPRQVPESTREFLALWNDAVEEHLVSELALSLPGLVPDERPVDAARAAGLARHVVRALRLAALSGDAAAGVRHLAAAGGPRDPK